MTWCRSTGVELRAVTGLLSILSVLATAPELATAQDDDLARCAAATPQFPQACPCVIERAEKAGIVGPMLSRLLSNDVAGLPIETFQAYGGIYVQCLQEVVLGTVPALPSAPPPKIAEPGPSAPLPTPPAVSSAPDAVLPEGAGQWRIDRFALRRDAPQASATAATDAGRRVSVVCDPRGGAHLLIDGVTEGPGIDYAGGLRILRSNGSQIVPSYPRYARVEGDHLMTGLSASDINALGAGSVAVIDSAAYGLSDRVGLSGSAAALRALQCIDRNPFEVGPLVFEYTGDWTANARLPDGEYTGGLLAGIDTVIHAEVGLACGDHFHLPSFRGADANRTSTVRVTVDDDPTKIYLLELGFNRGAAVAFNGVPDGFFRTLRAGRHFRVEDLRNGQGFVAVYDLAGLEEALQQIDCPADVGTPVPPPQVGWHVGTHVHSFGTMSDVLRRTDLGPTVAFSCNEGAPLDLMIGPVVRYRVLSAPATLAAGGVALELPAPLDQNDWVALRLPAEITAALAAAETLAVKVPAYELDLSIPLASTQSDIAALGCNAPEPFTPFNLDPDMSDLDFSGVDTQPWEPVNTPDQGRLLVMGGRDAAPGALHIGCNGRFALPAEAFVATDDTLPVSFSVGLEPYPRPALDFRREDGWWVFDAPALYADIVQGPYFGFQSLKPRNIGSRYGTGGLDAAQRAMCR